MPLPNPDLPIGTVLITFQANIEGYQPVTKAIPAAKVAKIMRAIDETMVINGAGERVPAYSGLADWAMKTLIANQFRDLDARYPDAPTAETLAIQAQIRELQAAVASQTQTPWIQDVATEAQG